MTEQIEPATTITANGATVAARIAVRGTSPAGLPRRALFTLTSDGRVLARVTDLDGQRRHGHYEYIRSIAAPVTDAQRLLADTAGTFGFAPTSH